MRAKTVNETKHISDFPYVTTFFKKYYPSLNIGSIPVYIILEEEWPDGKSRQTENDLNGGIKIHENEIKIDHELGWLIHEVGHVLELNGEKRSYLVSPKKFKSYPNAKNEQVPMWYQFHYLISKGTSIDDIIKLEKRDYSNCKGGGSLWSSYKDKFFREYYKLIKVELETKN